MLQQTIVASRSQKDVEALAGSISNFFSCICFKGLQKPVACLCPVDSGSEIKSLVVLSAQWSAASSQKLS